jgi:hypothetical protein
MSGQLAANREPASIIAAQLRHADGGGLAQRVYIHQLPQTAPRLAGVIEACSAQRRWMGRRCRQRVGRRETGGNPDPRTRPDPTADGHVFAAQGLCGRDRIRTCEGNAGDFTGRTTGSPRVPSHPHPDPMKACDVHKRPAGRFRRPSASPPVPPPPARPSVGRREVGGKSRQPSDQSPLTRVHTYFLPAFVSSRVGPMAVEIC